MTDLPFAHEIGEGAAGLVGGRVRVGPVHLVEIDVVGPQIPKARFDAFTQPARARISLQRVAFLAKAAFRRDDHAVPRHTRPKSIREKTFGRTEAIGLGGVEEGYAEVERATDGLARFVGVERAPVTAERPRSEGDRGNLEIGLAESDVSHGLLPRPNRALSRHAAGSWARSSRSARRPRAVG